MSKAAPITSPNRAAGAAIRFCLAGAAFCKLGVAFALVGPDCTGSAGTKLVVVITTTPPLSMVDVKVDVTGLSVGDEIPVGFSVVRVEPRDQSVQGRDHREVTGDQSQMVLQQERIQPAPWWSRSTRIT